MWNAICIFIGLDMITEIIIYWQCIALLVRPSSTYFITGTGKLPSKSASDAESILCPDVVICKNYKIKVIKVGFTLSRSTHWLGCKNFCAYIMLAAFLLHKFVQTSNLYYWKHASHASFFTFSWRDLFSLRGMWQARYTICPLICLRNLPKRI